MDKLGITLWGFDIGPRDAVALAVRAEDAGFHNVFMVRRRTATVRAPQPCCPVRKRRGASIVIWRICSSVTPAAISAGMAVFFRNR